MKKYKRITEKDREFDHHLPSKIRNYLQKADKLVKSKKAKNVDDIQMKLGYGIVDETMLYDTFFRK